MKIGFHEDHWWILVNGQKAYRLSIPRDITPEDARKHATNVLIYLAERAEIVHNLGASREGTTEGQPEIASGSCTRVDVREFDEVQALTAHVDRLADQLFGHTCTASLRDPSVGRDSVHASARKDPPAVVKPIAKPKPLDIVDICIDSSIDGTQATVRYEDRAGRRLLSTVKHHAGYWLISLSGDRFIDAHAKNGWNPTLATGTYVRRADCAGTLVTILRDVLNLPSPF